MKQNDSVRSPLDRIPFAIRALLAGALALSMIFISAAAALMLLTVAVDARPGKHLNLTHPARVVVVAVRTQARDSMARIRCVVRRGADVPCPLIANGFRPGVIAM